MKLENWSRNALSRAIGGVFPAKKWTPEAAREEWSEGRIRKILMIRPHQGLGDLLLASPVFRALKASRPDVELHFLADTYNAIAVKDNPNLDKIWTWAKKKAYAPWYLLSFLGALRRERYDLAIVISSHVPSFTSFLLAKASGAKIILAFATQSHYDGANWSRWLANLEIAKPAPETPEWVTFMDLVRPLGVSGSYEPQFFVGPAEKKWALDQWQTLNLPKGQPVVGMFLGGNPDRPERLWPATSWATLGGLLLEKKITVLAIVPPVGMISGSGHAEPGVYEEFSPLLGRRLPVFRHTQLTSVAAFLSNLNLFVCPDGGLMHIAIASRVPTLGLCFETDPDRWVPPVPWATGLRAPDARSSGLSPETVCAAIQRRLEISPVSL